jgi:hypothetical protein
MRRAFGRGGGALKVHRGRGFTTVRICSRVMIHRQRLSAVPPKTASLSLEEPGQTRRPFIVLDENCRENQLLGSFRPKTLTTLIFRDIPIALKRIQNDEPGHKTCGSPIASPAPNCKFPKQDGPTRSVGSQIMRVLRGTSGRKSGQRMAPGPRQMRASSAGYGQAEGVNQDVHVPCMYVMAVCTHQTAVSLEVELLK